MINKRRVTLEQIAAQLNISQNTISLVLRGRPGVSEATRTMVFNAAEELGYKPRKNQRSKKSKKNICIVTPYAGGSSTYYFSRYQLDIETSLRSAGCTVFTVNNAATDGTLAMLQNMCVLQEIKGLVIASDIGQTLIEQLQEMNIPMICAGFYHPSLNLDCVAEDDVSGMMLAVKELKKRHYRKFGFLGGIEDSSFFSRFMALQASLYKEGLDLISGAVFTQYSQDILCDPERLTEIIQRAAEMPEIFFCCNDKIAMTTIHALNRLGFRVPDDIGILGFDNTDFARISIPTLATIDNFPALQAEAITRRITERIEDPSMPALRILTRVEFVPGNSIR